VPRSADFQSAVSRIFNPQCVNSSSASLFAAPCRMQFGDTADYQSALRHWQSGKFTV
jgi:hypothetical protein